MSAGGPAGRLGWTLTLIAAVTVMIFVLEPDPGQEGVGAPSDPDRPWYTRFADWLDLLAHLEFGPGPDLPGRPSLSWFDALFAVARTWLVVGTAVGLIAAITVLVATLTRHRSPPRRPPGAGTVLAAALPLAWFTGTAAAAAAWLNTALGTNLLPVNAFAPTPAAGSVLPAMAEQLHVSVFPALVLVTVFAPVVLLVVRPAMLRSLSGSASVADAAYPATVAVLRLVPWLVPVLSVAAVVIELARGSDGVSRLLFSVSAEPAFPSATGLVLFGSAVAVVSWLVEKIVDLSGVDEQLPRRRRPPRMERLGVLWSRMLADRRAWWGAVLLAVVVLAASYTRLWFDVGPADVVSTDDAAPPSADHVLGIDTMGRDQLVRLAAAIGGSLFVASVASAIATLLGLAWMVGTARLPDRAGRLARAGADLLLAVPALAWLIMASGRSTRDAAFAWDGHRLTIAIVLGALAVPVAIRVLWRQCWFMVRNPNTPTRLAAPVAGTALALLTGGLLAENVATFLILAPRESAPTLGGLLARTVLDLPNELFPLTDPIDALSAWPWLWYPPGVVTMLLAAGTALLASAVLRRAED